MSTLTPSSPNSHPYRLNETRKAATPMTETNQPSTPSSPTYSELADLLKPADITAPVAQPIRSGWHANGARVFEIQLKSEFSVRVGRYTKSSILNDELKALEQAREQLNDEIERRRSYLFGLGLTQCNLSCSGCGTQFHTELDFANHFVLTAGPELKNTGDCPRPNKAGN